MLLSLAAQRVLCCFQFEDNEKKRMKAEQLRQDMKHKRQLEELQLKNNTSVKELEQLQVSHQINYLHIFYLFFYGVVLKKILCMQLEYYLSRKGSFLNSWSADI